MHIVSVYLTHLYSLGGLVKYTLAIKGELLWKIKKQSNLMKGQF